jgi:hypothetical protein
MHAKDNGSKHNDCKKEARHDYSELVVVCVRPVMNHMSLLRKTADIRRFLPEKATWLAEVLGVVIS